MVSERVSHLTAPQTSAGPTSEDSGIGFSKTPNEQEQATPSPTNATPTVLPPASEISAASSSTLYQGLSSLWLQLLVSKLTLNLYGSDELSGIEGCGSDRCSPIRVSVEAESVSLQLDVQERCTDVIFKISGVECDFSKLLPSSQSLPLGCGQWVPYLENSNGKLFSTTGSNLAHEVLQATAPGRQFAVCPLSPTPKFQPSFLYVKGLLPRGGRTTRGVKVQLSVCSFEAVVWVPVFEFVLSVIGSSSGENLITPTHQVKGHHLRCASCIY